MRLSAGSGSHIRSPRGLVGSAAAASSTMMRSERASPATIDSMSICWMMVAGRALVRAMRPSPLKQTVVLPPGVIVTLVFLPASLLAYCWIGGATRTVQSWSVTRLIFQLGAYR